MDTDKPEVVNFYKKISDSSKPLSESIKDFSEGIVESVEGISSKIIDNIESLFSPPDLKAVEETVSAVTDNISSFSYDACHSACVSSF